MKFQQKLKNLNACSSAVGWVNGMGIKKAEALCERADWMLWLYAKMKDKPGWPTHQEIVLVACWCARRAQKYWTDKKDNRPINAIKAVEKWAKNPTQENKNAAYAAAYSAAYSADATYSAYSAAADAAYAAADAAAYAADSAKRKVEHKIMCDYIRKTLKLGKFA